MRTRISIALFFLAVLFVYVEQASAMYDARTGRFLSRDPIDYGRGYVVERHPASPVDMHQPTGRFLPRDPVDENLEDVNLYRYVRNEPLDSVDPLGMSREDDVIASLGCDVTTGNPFITKGPAWDKFKICGHVLTLLHESVHALDMYSLCQDANSYYKSLIGRGWSKEVAKRMAELRYADNMKSEEQTTECRAYKLQKDVAIAAGMALGCGPTPCKYESINQCCLDLYRMAQAAAEGLEQHHCN